MFFLYRYVSGLALLTVLLIMLHQKAIASDFVLDPVIEGLPLSSAISQLPTGDIVIVHREGGFKVLSEDLNTTDIVFTPDDLFVSRQGGMIQIIPHPNYDATQWLYLSYAAGTQKSNYLKVIRFRLKGTKVSDVESVFRMATEKDTPVHFGGKMVFDKSGYLMITTGDGFDYREQAQRKQSHLGKVLRMTDLGKPVNSNPFFSAALLEGDYKPESYVFTLGHRNPQGLIMLRSGLVVLNEHGPAGGDEINVLSSGVNYGWPVVTNGLDYIGATISPFKDYPGMRLPNVDWTPSIAPSSMIFYDGDKFPSLKNLYLVTSLKFKNIYLVEENFTTANDKRLFSDAQVRLRDILSTQNGEVFILGDGDGASLYKLAIRRKGKASERHANQ